MPKYNFRCDKCQSEKVVFTVQIGNIKQPICEKCKTKMKKRIGKPKKTIVKTRSKVTGKNITENVTEELKKRSHDHFMKHEMEDLIAEHGRETAERLGWVDKKTGKKKRVIDEK